MYTSKKLADKKEKERPLNRDKDLSTAFQNGRERGRPSLRMGSCGCAQLRTWQLASSAHLNPLSALRLPAAIPHGVPSAALSVPSQPGCSRHCPAPHRQGKAPQPHGCRFCWPAYEAL